MKPPNFSDDFIKNNNYFFSFLSPIMIRFRLRSARSRWSMSIMWRVGLRSRFMLLWRCRLRLMLRRGRCCFRRMHWMIVLSRRWRGNWSIVSIIFVIHHIRPILMDHFIQWIKQDRARAAHDTGQEYKQCLFHN